VVCVQRFLIRARLIECSLGHDDAVVVVKRPKSVVEKPMGILAQGKPVTRVVVSGIGKLVDVGGVHDRWTIKMVVTR
jgi:hypothetical protein